LKVDIVDELLKARANSGHTDDYVIFDCPGQVELFTHHSSLRNIFFRLQKLGYRVRRSFLYH
jgi:GTPase SAR1 family protein